MSLPFTVQTSTRTLFADPWRRRSVPSHAICADVVPCALGSSAMERDGSSNVQSDPSGVTADSRYHTCSTSQDAAGSRKASFPSIFNQARRGSLSSFSRRSSCFSILEAEEECKEFGEHVVGLLEPRNSIGWWSIKEVLRETNKGEGCVKTGLVHVGASASGAAERLIARPFMEAHACVAQNLEE